MRRELNFWADIDPLARQDFMGRKLQNNFLDWSSAEKQNFSKFAVKTNNMAKSKNLAKQIKELEDPVPKGKFVSLVNYRRDNFIDLDFFSQTSIQKMISRRKRAVRKVVMRVMMDWRGQNIMFKLGKELF